MLDVECVRVPDERAMRAVLLGVREYVVAAKAPRETDTAIRRRLQTNSLQLSPTLAPHLNATLSRVVERLEIHRSVEIYQTAGYSIVETQASCIEGTTIFVQVIGRALRLLDDDGVAAILGHEIGHALAGHAAWGATHMLTSRSDDVGACARHLLLSQELTADRFGLMACRSLNAFLAIEMVERTGFAVSELPYRPEDYLAQCREWMDELNARDEGFNGVTHPEHAMRSYAAWLFSETDAYADLTGSGPATRTLDSVNTSLAVLLKRSTRAAVTPNGHELGEAPRNARSVLSSTSHKLAKFADAARSTVLRVLDGEKHESTSALSSDGVEGEVEGEVNIDPDPKGEAELLARFAELERRPRR